MNLVPDHILTNRRSSIDVFRGIAILLVVFYHFDHILPFGFLGVDLFFVISGYLVSKGFLVNLKKNEKISWKIFALKRLTKILPSYYFFLIVGTLIARLLLLDSHPDQVIGFDDFPKYIFFYMNYAEVFQWSFELAWSLCVEEHFYIFLPFLFICLTTMKSPVAKRDWLGRILIISIIAVWIVKFLGYHMEWNTYTPTHMRIDGLLIGVLLSYQEIVTEKITKNSMLYTILGTILLTIALIGFYTSESKLFHKVGLHVLIALGYYAMVRGLLFAEFRGFTLIRIIAYFSYNWYLWHALVSFILLNLFDFYYGISLLLYLTISFAIAVITTKLIEEPIINKRHKLLSHIYSK